MLCKEKLAFSKMAAICEFEERYGVELGTGYKNKKVCATFVDYISQELQHAVVNYLIKPKFLGYSLAGVRIQETLRMNFFS